MSHLRVGFEVDARRARLPNRDMHMTDEEVRAARSAFVRSFASSGTLRWHARCRRRQW
jgi:hypothetical protein